MLIKNQDALKVWLAAVLEPLCDADPSALARYVFALLKKDKPVKDLKKSMTDQLDVFLVNETKPFLDRLFAAIASEEYLIPPPPTITKQPPMAVTNLDTLEAITASMAGAASGVILETKHDKECTPPLFDMKAAVAMTTTTTTAAAAAAIVATKESVNRNDEIVLNFSSTEELVTPLAGAIGPTSPLSTTAQNSPTKAASDKENQPRESRRQRILQRSRSRSRSRSPPEQRLRRSRSRDRGRMTDKRIFRNKSPPPLVPGIIGSDRRRLDRRGIMGDRSPRTNDKQRTKSHSASRSRSPTSPERRKISRSSSPQVAANENNNLFSKRQRCRDFDEKGYCVRGETCPWDHGVNPVVLEGINNPTLIGMPSHLREYNPDAPELWNRSGPGAGGGGGGGGGANSGGGGGGGFPGGRGGTFPHKSGIVPNNYSRPPGPGFRPAGGAFPFPINPAATPLQRELIPVPVVDANAGGDISAMQSKRRYEPEDTVAIAEGPTKRKLPINSRLGPRVGPQQNCTLELRKIPRGMNTITHLNNHFSKFGKIVNIQIAYEGDPEAATVTFSTHAEANVAYRSTEAVLNNRFIKVFWHSPGNAEMPGGAAAMAAGKDDIIPNGRKQSQYHLNNVIPAVPATVAESAKTANPAGGGVATTSSATTGSTATGAAIATATIVPGGSVRLKTNRPPTSAQLRRKQEDHMKNAVQLAHGLQKRKNELLREYVKEMKAAVDLVEKTDPSDPARAVKLLTIKDLQTQIDKLRKELASEQVHLAQIQTNQLPPVKKTKEQQKKELLDLELELIAQQQEGNDTSAIQKRVEDLQRSLGITSVSSASSASSSHKSSHFNRNLRMRPVAPHVSTVIDRRPSTLLISGFDSNDCDLLLGHFKHFGEITKHEVDRNIPQLTIAYATRSNAEQAVIRGRVFKEKRLQVAWAQTVQNKIENPSVNNTQSANNNKTTTADPVVSDNNNRMEDEEEEEDGESEDRSWRR